MGEDRPGHERERLRHLVPDGRSGHVAGEQVGCALHASEARRDRPCERVRQRRLAAAGCVLDEHVPAGQERGRQLAHGDVLPAHDLGHVVDLSAAGMTSLLT